MESSSSRPSNASPAEPLESDKCTPKPDVKRPSWFTPCKQLGLKRKSSSVTTPGSAKLSSSISTPNSSFKSHRQRFVTPIKKNDLAGAKAVEEGEVSVQTPLLLATDETPSTPNECDVEKGNAHINTSIPSTTTPYNKVTLVRSRPRLSMSAIINKSKTEAETLELEELTEETIDILRKRIKEKEERVSALKLTQLHKKKNNTDKLLQLTKKWLSGCQDALQQLLEKTRALGYQHTMSELLVQLRIPHDLVQYDPDLEDFKE